MKNELQTINGRPILELGASNRHQNSFLTGARNGYQWVTVVLDDLKVLRREACFAYHQKEQEQVGDEASSHNNNNNNKNSRHKAAKVRDFCNCAAPELTLSLKAIGASPAVSMQVQGTFHLRHNIVMELTQANVCWLLEAIKATRLDFESAAIKWDEEAAKWNACALSKDFSKFILNINTSYVAELQLCLSMSDCQLSVDIRITSSCG